MKMGICFIRRVLTAAFLLCFIQANAEPALWDLADSDIAERFFNSSQISATFYMTNGVQRVEWTATTPVPTACGSSVFFQSQNTDSYYWKHIFSEAMDPSVPSTDHVV
jgi:hypothetical protein